MKFLAALTLAFISFSVKGQYYQKDIIGTSESSELISNYSKAKVRSVALNSYTINNTPINGFNIRQEFLPAQRALRTVTQSEYTDASYLTTYIDANGRVVKTTDSSSGVVNATLYTYNATGKLTAVLFSAGDTLTAVKTDDHLWQYDAQGRVKQMLRIKNKRDTSVVSFKLDGAGNVIEEQERRRALQEQPWLYYYDANNRLTDVVRWNDKAARYLPEIMFEYSPSNQVIQRVTIPQNSDDYLIWRYAYDSRGLKTKEVIFNKQREQTGKVEYVYTFGE